MTDEVKSQKLWPRIKIKGPRLTVENVANKECEVKVQIGKVSEELYRTVSSTFFS